jgi:hypothetical protein
VVAMSFPVLVLSSGAADLSSPRGATSVVA